MLIDLPAWRLLEKPLWLAAKKSQLLFWLALSICWPRWYGGTWMFHRLFDIGCRISRHDCLQDWKGTPLISWLKFIKKIISVRISGGYVWIYAGGKVVLLDFEERELVLSGIVHWISPAPPRAGEYFWIKLNFLPETFPDSH